MEEYSDKKEELIKRRKEIKEYLESKPSIDDYIEKKKNGAVIRKTKRLYNSLKNAGFLNIESMLGDFIDELKKKSPNKKYLKKYSCETKNELENMNSSSHNVGELSYIVQSQQIKPF